MGSFPHSLVVRDAAEGDAYEVARLGSLVFGSTFGHSVEPHQLQTFLEETNSLESIAKEITNPSKKMVVATDGVNGEIVGFALLARGTSEPCIKHLKNTVELQQIYVRPDKHGKGAGRLLANHLEVLARAEGFLHMWLGVWEENHKARQVYERWGYRKVGQHDFVIGDVVQKDDIMLKQL